MLKGCNHHKILILNLDLHNTPNIVSTVMEKCLWKFPIHLTILIFLLVSL